MRKLRQLFEKYFLWIFFLLIYTLIFQSLIKESIVIHFQRLFLIPQDIVYDIVILSLLGISIISFILKLKKSNYRIDCFYFLNCVPFLVLYVVTILLLSNDANVSFRFLPSTSIRFFDILFITILLVFYPIIYRNITNKNDKFSFLRNEKYSHDRNHLDLFKREEYAKFIAEKIAVDFSTSSLAISVRGEWGSGKTYFVSQICKHLANNSGFDFQILNVQVWGIEKNLFVPKIVDDLNSIANRVDPQLRKSIKKHYKYTVQSDNIWVRIVDSLSKLFSYNVDDSNKRSELDIGEILVYNKTKVIIIIDDIDRLNKEEIDEVLKSVKIDFDFKNVYFIIPFDESVLFKLIERKFLDKIFQLNITLPSYPSKVVLDFLLSNVLDQFEVKPALKRLFSNLNVTDYIKNIREASIFLNYFNLQIKQKYDEVEIEDFILVLLIKTIDSSIYSALSDFFLLNIDSEYFFVNKGTSGIVQYQETSAQAPVNKLLSTLFPNIKDQPSTKSIRLKYNGIRYFSDDLFGRFSFSKVEPRSNDIQELVSYINSFKDPDDFYSLSDYYNAIISTLDIDHLVKTSFVLTRFPEQRLMKPLIERYLQEIFMKPYEMKRENLVLFLVDYLDFIFQPMPDIRTVVCLKALVQSGLKLETEPFEQKLVGNLRTSVDRLSVVLEKLNFVKSLHDALEDSLTALNLVHSFLRDVCLENKEVFKKTLIIESTQSEFTSIHKLAKSLFKPNELTNLFSEYSKEEYLERNYIEFYFAKLNAETYNKRKDLLYFIDNNRFNFRNKYSINETFSNFYENHDLAKKSDSFRDMPFSYLPSNLANGEFDIVYQGFIILPTNIDLKGFKLRCNYVSYFPLSWVSINGVKIDLNKPFIQNELIECGELSPSTEIQFCVKVSVRDDSFRTQKRSLFKIYFTVKT